MFIYEMIQHKISQIIVFLQFKITLFLISVYNGTIFSFSLFTVLMKSRSMQFPQLLC